MIINTSPENYTITPVWCRIRRLVLMFVYTWQETAWLALRQATWQVERLGIESKRVFSRSQYFLTKNAAANNQFWAYRKLARFKQTHKQFKALSALNQVYSTRVDDKHNKIEYSAIRRT